MGLDDLAGAYLSRALRNNKSIVKLDLDSNMFGPQTCIALADSLTTNTTVEHVNLESNLLSRSGNGGHDLTGISAMAKMLTTNKTLKYVNMWRCNIGSEGGQLLLQGINKNSTLLFFQLGNNGLSQTHSKRISDRLDENNQLEREGQELKQVSESVTAIYSGRFGDVERECVTRVGRAVRPASSVKKNKKGE